MMMLVSRLVPDLRGEPEVMTQKEQPRFERNVAVVVFRGRGPSFRREAD
jgi:hypothetical protein